MWVTAFIFRAIRLKNNDNMESVVRIVSYPTIMLGVGRERMCGREMLPATFYIHFFCGSKQQLSKYDNFQKAQKLGVRYVFSSVNLRKFIAAFKNKIEIAGQITGVCQSKKKILNNVYSGQYY